MQDQQWVPALSKLFLTIAAAFAEAERDRIRERVAQVKRDKEGALEGIPEQQAAIAAPGSCGPAGAPLRTIQAAPEAELGARVSLDALARVVREAAA